MQGLANTVLSSDSPWVGYNFSSRRNSFHPEITEENDDAVSAGDDSNSEYGEEGLDLESNHSNSDIIPFSEGEYEKITVDTDCQTDGEQNNGRLSAGSSGSSSLDTGKSGKTSGCETDGIDSALGRSVSDDRVSVGTEAQPNVTHCSILLTSDSASKGASNKVVSFAPQAKDPEEDMKTRPEGDTMVSSRASSKKKSEPHDIGYSSESHSNDEDTATATKGVNLATQTDPNSNGKLPFTTSSPILPPKQLMSLDNVVLRKKALVPGQDTGSSSGNDADNTPSPTCADKSWRHSMTSAYDTSSNCSDFNNPLDLDMTLETTVSCDTSICTTIGEDPGMSSGAEVQEKVQSLEASPSRKFYSVAGVESDASSAYSTARKCLNTSLDGAYTTDNELNNSKEVDFVEGDVASRFQHSTPVKDNESDADGQRPSPYPGSASAKMLNLGDPWRQISKGKWPIFDRSESLSVQQDSEASSREAALNDDDFPECSEEGKHQVPSASNESIKRLIQQAELLVRDTDLINIPSNKSWVRRRKRASNKSSKCSSNSNNNSLNLPPTIESGPSVPTTDFSANPTDRDSNVSSCDASSEGSSESEGEYSTASSDPDDQQYTSAVHSLGTSRSGVLTSSTSSGSTMLRTYHPPKRANHGERPWSITELYELTNRLDLSPFSISESAIDDISKKNSAMQTSQSDRLRRTISDMSSQRPKDIDTGRKHRKRKLKRSASDDHEQMRTTNEDPFLPGVSSPPCFTQSCVEWRTSSHSYSSLDKSGASCSEGQNVSTSFYRERLPTASPLPEQARRNTTDSDLDEAGKSLTVHATFYVDVLHLSQSFPF